MNTTMLADAVADILQNPAVKSVEIDVAGSTPTEGRRLVDDTIGACAQKGVPLKGVTADPTAVTMTPQWEIVDGVPLVPDSTLSDRVVVRRK